jgi:hypothetical protein
VCSGLHLFNPPCGGGVAARMVGWLGLVLPAGWLVGWLWGFCLDGRDPFPV